MKFDCGEVIKIIECLIGDIEPKGDSNADSEIFNHIKVWEQVNDYMISRMLEIHQDTESRYENSILTCHQSIDGYLKYIVEYLKDYGFEAIQHNN